MRTPYQGESVLLVTCYISYIFYIFIMFKQ